LNVKHIVLVASGKGGVGKSTVAVGLALKLAKEGKKVGLLDADLYGPSIPYMCDLQDKQLFTKEVGDKTKLIPFVFQGVKVMSIGFLIKAKQPIIWRGPMVSTGISQLLADTYWGELDYLIVDTPPGTGDIHITLLQNFHPSGVLVVTTPQQLALVDVKKAVAMYQDKKFGVPVLGVVENMSWFTPSIHPDEKYYIFGKGGGEALSNEFSMPLLAQLPINENLCNEGKSDRFFEDELFVDSFKQLSANVQTELHGLEVTVS
jgi:ATP-binding protein involved in chromosome partitioning